MRNSVDQADEQTNGANKRSLLTGERATIAPDPGTSSVPKPAPSSPIRRSTPRPAAKEYNNAAPAKVTAPPPAVRPTVDVYEGAKKKTVDFP
jgi:hypothetical protein